MSELAEYKWRPEFQLVEVHLQKPLEFKADLHETFFAGRRARVAKTTNQWLGVTCAMQEWQEYLTFVFGSLSMQLHLQDTAHEVFEEIHRFRVWRMQIEAGVGFKPTAGVLM